MIDTGRRRRLVRPIRDIPGASLNRYPIAQSIVDAEQRGVRVRIIGDLSSPITA